MEFVWKQPPFLWILMNPYHKNRSFSNQPIKAVVGFPKHDLRKNLTTQVWVAKLFATVVQHPSKPISTKTQRGCLLAYKDFAVPFRFAKVVFKNCCFLNAPKTKIALE